MTDATRTLHAKIGWWGLFASVLVGLFLEALLAWKRPEILDAGQETRRLLFRLAHAHAGVLSLVHLAFAALLGRSALGVHEAEGASGDARDRRVGTASKLLVFGSALLPLGFLLGGAFMRGSDPGAGILFAPIGAVALAVAFFLAARSS